jgi:hypothetical protein
LRQPGGLEQGVQRDELAAQFEVDLAHQSAACKPNSCASSA